MTDEGFVLPSCRFDREGAEALIRLAKNRLEDFDIPLPESRERLAEMLHSHAGIVTRVLRTKGMEELMEIGLMNIPQTTEKDIKDGGA